MCYKPNCCADMQAEVDNLREQLDVLRNSYVAHLAHAHGVFGSDTIKRTKYVGIREKIKHGSEQDGDSTAPAST